MDSGNKDNGDLIASVGGLDIDLATLIPGFDRDGEQAKAL